MRELPRGTKPLVFVRSDPATEGTGSPGRPHLHRLARPPLPLSFRLIPEGNTGDSCVVPGRRGNNFGPWRRHECWLLLADIEGSTELGRALPVRYPQNRKARMPYPGLGDGSSPLASETPEARRTSRPRPLGGRPTKGGSLGAALDEEGKSSGRLLGRLPLSLDMHRLVPSASPEVENQGQVGDRHSQRNQRRGPQRLSATEQIGFVDHLLVG